MFARLTLTFLFCFPALSADPLWEVRYDGKPVFYAEVDPQGQVFKAYPKPRVPIGKYAATDGNLRFEPAAHVADTDHYYPLVANVFKPSALDEPSLDLLKGLLFKSTDTKVPLARGKAGLTVEKWTGPELKLDWGKIELRPVPEEEMRKISAFERGLLGKWKFVRMTDAFGEVTGEVLQYRNLEFCANGKCVADKQDKVYWVDGRFLRLSFQKSEKWEEYSMTEEYDIESEKDEMVIRHVDGTNPPSRNKDKSVDERYEGDSLKRAYYFQRIAP